MSLVVFVVLLLTDALFAIGTGLVARFRGRRFWVWAIPALVVPVISLIAVLVLPRQRRGRGRR